MAHNKKRKGHPFRKPPDIPANERVKGKTFWAILFAVFGLIIGFLVGGGDIIILAPKCIGWWLDRLSYRKEHGGIQIIIKGVWC